MVDILETFHAVDAGRTEPKPEEATKQASASHAWSVHEFRSGRALVTTVVASHNHGQVDVSDYDLCIIVSLEPLSVVIVMMTMPMIA